MDSKAAQGQRRQGAEAARAVPLRRAPFQLRASSFTALVLKLVDVEDPTFLALLSQRLRQAPNFYRDAPVVLDLAEAVGWSQSVDLMTLVGQLRGLDLVPVGVQNGSEEQSREAVAAGLALLPKGRNVESQPERRQGPAVVKPVYRPTRLVEEPVRSGTQVYAEGGDLIVAAAVSAGAEILADGHVHVYGPLRGRALAGVSGDTTARIFCQSLEAELVSIAGRYQVVDESDARIWRRRVQVSLEGDSLILQPQDEAPAMSRQPPRTR